MGPEFIIRIKEEPTPRPVEFGELFALKDRLQSLTLLWNCNSYLVNRDRRCFYINGGRKIEMPEFRGCTDLAVYYRRRHQKDISFGGGDNNAHRVSYLLGFEGSIHGKIKLVTLQISEDGTQWVWKDNK